MSRIFLVFLLLPHCSAALGKGPGAACRPAAVQDKAIMGLHQMSPLVSFPHDVMFSIDCNSNSGDLPSFAIEMWARVCAMLAAWLTAR